MCWARLFQIPVGQIGQGFNTPLHEGHTNLESGMLKNKALLVDSVSWDETDWAPDIDICWEFENMVRPIPAHTWPPGPVDEYTTYNGPSYDGVEVGVGGQPVRVFKYPKPLCLPSSPRGNPMWAVRLTVPEGSGRDFRVDIYGEFCDVVSI